MIMKRYSGGQKKGADMSIESFVRSDRGALTPLMLVLFIGLVVITGTGIDIVRHEAERADLQDALDRGVLAAAQFSQSIDPELVVGDYLRSRNFGDGSVDFEVRDISQNVSEKRITASASFEQDTIFLAMVGVPTLDVATSADAVQSRDQIEISLVLDISGTMRFNSRIENTRLAAKDFIDEMLKDGGDATTSISIVPYAGQVNPGFAMYNAIGGVVRGHNFSSCPELQVNDLSGTGLPASGTYQHVPHFHVWPIDDVYMDWGWCPLDPKFAYVKLSDTSVIAAETLAEAEALVALDNTLADGIYSPPVPRVDENGDAVLDELGNPIVDVNDELTLKRVSGTSITYLHNNAGVLKERIDAIRLHDGTGTYNGMKWGLALLDPTTAPTLASNNLIEGTLTNRPLPFVADNLKVMVLMTDGQITEQYRPLTTNAADPSLETNEIGTNNAIRTLDRTTGRDRFYLMCDQARQLGMEVFTIAFEAPSNAVTEMERCAYGPTGQQPGAPTRFYDAQDGDQLAQAFQDISAQLYPTRLVGQLN
ncbi:MAG: Tad domain-containing protein [Pseudomonadota bacterium]